MLPMKVWKYIPRAALGLQKGPPLQFSTLPHIARGLVFYCFMRSHSPTVEVYMVEPRVPKLVG